MRKLHEMFRRLEYRDGEGENNYYLIYTTNDNEVIELPGLTGDQIEKLMEIEKDIYDIHTNVDDVIVEMETEEGYKNYILEGDGSIIMSLSGDGSIWNHYVIIEGGR